MMDIESTVVVLDGKQWEKDLPELGDFEVLVAPWENAAFDKAMQKGIRALPPGLRADGNVDPASYYRVVGRAIARTILFDWKNYRVGGADKPFDAAYAETILTDPRYRTIRDGIIAAAKRVQFGVKAEEEALLGNSATSSVGSATGQAIPTT
jgi:hypothetical protein